MIWARHLLWPLLWLTAGTAFAQGRPRWAMSTPEGHPASIQLHLNNDIMMSYGSTSAAPLYWWIYDSVNTQFELNGTNCDGAGTDCVLAFWDDGTNDMKIAGDLNMSNGLLLNIGVAGTDFTVDGGLTLAGLLVIQDSSDIAVYDDSDLRFGADTDYWLHYDSSDTRLELFTTNGDGAGADRMVASVPDGTDDVLVYDQVCVGNNGTGGGNECIGTTGAQTLQLKSDGSARVEVNNTQVIVASGNDLLIRGGAKNDTGPTVIEDDAVTQNISVTRTAELIFCGQGPNAATTVYLSPRNTGLFGDATCDAEDNTTEATADEVWAPFDFTVVSMECGISDVAVDASGVTFAFRDDTADASGDLTCTTGAGDGAGFMSCEDMDESPPTVAAGSAIAMRAVAATGNFSTGDILCRVTISQ